MSYCQDLPAVPKIVSNSGLLWGPGLGRHFVRVYSPLNRGAVSSMGRTATRHFDGYRNDFPMRAPDLANRQYEDELLDITGRPDVLEFSSAPCLSFLTGAPPKVNGEDGEKKYVWLVGPDNVLYALEKGKTGMSLSRKKLAHTNFSGGGLAHCGGELWFRDNESIWLTGGSSRYCPRSPAELEQIVASFRSAGYRVASAGWAEEIGRPSRVFRGEVAW